MQPLTRKEFFDKYWFTPYHMVTVVNPKAEDYPFMVEQRHFMIKAGATETIPGTVANVYLNQMTKILAQDEDRMEHLSDYNLMQRYFDRLIVNVENTIREDRSTPAYLQNVPDSVKGDAPETPPWQQPPVAPQPPAEPPKSPEAPKEEVKEFELGNDKYKMITDKNGQRMYYMNGKLTSEANYSKAASML